jgi:3-deoxy-D-manno-octulosonate 8-phosphate phosphatase (KDO 8-P phosphatase)
MPPATNEIAERARHIHLLLLDCDGVLTDGNLFFISAGEQFFDAVKVFHIHDGQGLRLAKEAGLKLGIITGRNSPALAARAGEMGIDHLRQGVANKLEVYEQIKAAETLRDEQIAYIGDDLPDLALMRRVGLAIAVADAVAEIRESAHFITERRGGRGAVREAVELILKTQGAWDTLIERMRH